MIIFFIQSQPIQRVKINQIYQTMIYDKEMMRQAFADCKATCEKEIQSLDDDIEYFQTIYLLKTRNHGNLLKGFDQYKDSKIFKFNIPKSATESKNEKIECQEKTFSLTSVTCKVNKQYELFCKTHQQDKQKNLQNNKIKSKTQKPVRVIHKVKTEDFQVKRPTNTEQSESETPSSESNKFLATMQQVKKLKKIKTVKDQQPIQKDIALKKNLKPKSKARKTPTKIRGRRMRKTLVVESSEQQADICKMINKKIKVSSSSQSSDFYQQSSQSPQPKKRRLL